MCEIEAKRVYRGKVRQKYIEREREKDRKKGERKR